MKKGFEPAGGSKGKDSAESRVDGPTVGKLDHFKVGSGESRASHITSVLRSVKAHPYMGLRSKMIDLIWFDVIDQI